MLSMVNGQPRELGLRDILLRFIDHRVDVVRRRTDYLLRKAREREHILLGFQIALDHLDKVIKLIRAAATPKEARDSLIGRFDFTERQAQAIIELQLQRLTGMEQQKILDELADIQQRIAEYLEILGLGQRAAHPDHRSSCARFRRRSATIAARRSSTIPARFSLEDLVQQEDVAVTVSRGGYLKRTPLDTYRRQSRGGKGRIGMGMRTEDIVEHLVIANTHTYLLVFTNKGRVYWLKIYEIPEARRRARASTSRAWSSCSRTRPCNRSSRSASSPRTSTSSWRRATA